MYIFQPVSDKYTTCCGLRQSSGILIQKYMREMSSNMYQEKGPLFFQLSFTKIPYKNRMCCVCVLVCEETQNYFANYYYYYYYSTSIWNFCTCHLKEKGPLFLIHIFLDIFFKCYFCNSILDDCLS